MHPDLIERIREINAQLTEEQLVRAHITELCSHIIHELRTEGQCRLIFCGKILDFDLEINSCEIYIDGDWVDSITRYSLIREFLENIAEV